MMRQLPITTEPRGQEPEPAVPPTTVKAAEPVLCNHCGRTASNAISCIGMCVADSGY